MKDSFCADLGAFHSLEHPVLGQIVDGVHSFGMDCMGHCNVMVHDVLAHAGKF